MPGGCSGTSAHSVLVPVLVLVLVEVTVEPGPALHPVCTGHCAVTVLSPARGAHPAAAAVIQHGARAARRSAARGLTALRTVHRVLAARAPAGREAARFQREQDGAQQEHLHDDAWVARQFSSLAHSRALNPARAVNSSVSSIK